MTDQGYTKLKSKGPTVVLPPRPPNPFHELLRNHSDFKQEATPPSSVKAVLPPIPPLNPPAPVRRAATPNTDTEDDLPRYVSDLTSPDMYSLAYQTDARKRLFGVDVQECAKSVRVDAKVVVSDGSNAIVILRFVKRLPQQHPTVLLLSTPDDKFGIGLRRIGKDQEIVFRGPGIECVGRVVTSGFDRLWDSLLALPV